VDVLSHQFSNFILLAHKPVELLHTVRTDRFRTEWNYKYNFTTNDTKRCSYNCTDTTLGEFFHPKCGS